MSQPRRRLPAVMVLMVVAGSVLAASGLGLAQANKERKGDPKGGLKGDDPARRVSGVIVKVEDLKKGEERGKEPRRHHRLSVNTAAVWQDYVRDQAPESRRGHNKADAAKGAQSIATEGQPKSEDTLATIDVGPETRVEVRFRASDDETTAGAATPAAAVAEEKESGKVDKKKAARAHLRDLKPGLFIEADYRHEEAKNYASRVVIIKPIGGPNTPDSEPGAEVKATKKAGR